MTYGNSKLSYDQSAQTDISPGNFRLYRPFANDISARCEGCISPTASDVSGLIYADRMMYTTDKLSILLANEENADNE